MMMIQWDSAKPLLDRWVVEGQNLEEVDIHTNLARQWKNGGNMFDRDAPWAEYQKSFAPYYNREFFGRLVQEGQSNLWIDLWCQQAGAESTGNLGFVDFQPRSYLITPVSDLGDPVCPIIDAHNHLDSLKPDMLLSIMDRSGVEVIMSLSDQRTGDDYFPEVDRLKAVLGDRLICGAPVQWWRLGETGFADRVIDNLRRGVEKGATNALKIYKNLGVVYKDELDDGKLVRLDDERIAPIFEACGRELNIPVVVHVADPEAFFHPLNGENERLKELAAHPDWYFFSEDLPDRRQLLGIMEQVLVNHPATLFQCVHVGNDPENLGNVATMLNRHPNMVVDIAARVAELGRQPHRARKFFMAYADRIMFGSDLPPHEEMYALYRRFLETDDDYFPYPTHVSGQGEWRISGINLPEEALRKVYHDNAARIYLKQDIPGIIEANKAAGATDFE
ncbi:amidohydrolase family protein [candidate division KSB1 bacterium]